jgi:hypothetical protein
VELKQMKRKLNATAMVVGLLFGLPSPSLAATAEYRTLGYLYLSPQPQAEYTSAQTRFVLVRFSEVSPSAITNLSTFITVTGASSGAHSGLTHIAGDGRTVIFTMSRDFTDQELVTVTLNPGLASMSDGTALPYQYQFSVSRRMAADTNLGLTNSILREYWTGISGATINDLKLSPNYPSNPSGTNLLPSFECPLDWVDDSGTRLRGYITAQVTGAYVFWLATDDYGELWLSTNSFASNVTRIAYVSGWTSSREWNKYASQKSVSISMVAGQKYYVEALQKESGGGDNLAVGWAKPGQSTSTPSEIVPGEVLSPWISGASSASIIPIKAGERPAPGQPGIMPNGVSVPSDFPHINITVNSNPDPGYIFIDNRGGGGKPYNIIFDNTGSPIWYQKMPDERRDMKVQRNGILTMFARTGGDRFVGLNTNYVEVASYWALNGHSTDEHELVVQPDGGYLLIGLRHNTVDMSKYVGGGNPTASVGETVIQEFTAAGELIFQWRAWDHYDIRDLRLDNPTAGSMRFPHMNALEIDTDGHILVSCRHLSEVTKINRNTGEIIWRLSGAHSDFTFVNDSLNGFENQHAIRVSGTNRYTLFDNGDLHNPPVSRAVEYELDLTNRTATVVWQYPGTPTTSLYSHYMANAQRLPNGNTLINWAVGHLPKLTEIRPNGAKAFEMNWVAGYEAYRVWRCAWQGNALKPNLLIESYPDKLILLFNKFGDPTVGYYRIYGGTSPNPVQVLATSPVTMATLKNLENNRQYYFRVTAVSTNGVESPFSDEQSVLVNLTRPGQNMVPNPSFVLGQTSWLWTVSGTASATWNIVNGASYVDVVSPGSALSDIQLRQAGLKLIQGQEYVRIRRLVRGAADNRSQAGPGPVPLQWIQGSLPGVNSDPHAFQVPLRDAKRHRSEYASGF